MQYTLLSILFATLFARLSFALDINPANPTKTPDGVVASQRPILSFTTISITAPAGAQASSSAPITVAPLPTADINKRQWQCCYNEQGFQVDCATWTGYYYSWGPAGNPYQGGPQCNGGPNAGSGSGGGGAVTTVVYVGSSPLTPVPWYLVLLVAVNAIVL